jgi:hypothetical protein
MWDESFHHEVTKITKKASSERWCYGSLGQRPEAGLQRFVSTYSDKKLRVLMEGVVDVGDAG